ncbi:hypothetical protein [Vibrio harveyi]|uniref:hypothetical protein n=1 Tax=Vibrio harveyi TaxID=669 RepID=UPI000680577F|nr:hypothetical protein [Vibrio harveyi]
MSNDHLIHLQTRLGVIIANTCNTIGCDDCDLKWDDGCSATDLQGKIHDEELKEMAMNGDNNPTD